LICLFPAAAHPLKRQPEHIEQRFDGHHFRPVAIGVICETINPEKKLAK
jgi:hypothetical protein